MLNNRLLLSCAMGCAMALSAFAASAQIGQGLSVTRDHHHRAGIAGRGDRYGLERLVGDKLSQAWGQPVVVENKAGAANMVKETSDRPRRHPTATHC